LLARLALLQLLCFRIQHFRASFGGSFKIFSLNCGIDLLLFLGATG
jgi:hypothetical protein